MKPLMLNPIGKIRIGREGPHTLGIFATRSPYRPNPIGLSTARILAINEESGIIQLAYLDADEGSPVLDLKPYTPSLDRVEIPHVPDWCAHWPQSLEESASFDWSNEFRWSDDE
ncbi:TrmO family methyltransferase [Paenibacillus dendritiformis]|uniref:TrmO family methyltransferase domain-containing protein n=1 Tax=Paenibacillus dendritiformis TaxID=130049 RepID=UPI00248B81CB|nr:TrmO family methyltransferase [Paenibacillus dendritiformis]WGU91996.1 TrmO family methyltransferase [Paenibacillus dendritiformis]